MSQTHFVTQQIEDDVYLIQGNADLEDVCETLGLEVRLCGWVHGFVAVSFALPCCDVLACTFTI